MTWVIISLGPTGGVSGCYGPFDDEETAKDWVMVPDDIGDIEEQFDHWIAIPLTAPTEDEED